MKTDKRICLTCEQTQHLLTPADGMGRVRFASFCIWYQPVQGTMYLSGISLQIALQFKHSTNHKTLNPVMSRLVAITY